MFILYLFLIKIYPQFCICKCIISHTCVKREKRSKHYHAIQRECWNWKSPINLCSHVLIVLHPCCGGQGGQGVSWIRISDRTHWLESTLVEALTPEGIHIIFWAGLTIRLHFHFLHYHGLHNKKVDSLFRIFGVSFVCFGFKAMASGTWVKNHQDNE